MFAHCQRPNGITGAKRGQILGLLFFRAMPSDLVDTKVGVSAVAEGNGTRGT